MSENAMAVSLRERSYRPELMDDGPYSATEYVECLRQIALLNRWTGGYRPTLNALEYFASIHAQRSSGEPLRVLDIGFGYGDTLRAIAHWARSREIQVELVGVDINPLSEKVSRPLTPSWMPIRYLTEDVFDLRPELPYHVIINALFMHHLDDEHIVRVLDWMRDYGTLGFFINDLHRHPLAYKSIRFLTKIFGFNRLIRHDAPLSVARSFIADDWRAYGRMTGLEEEKLRIEWNWAFRYGVLYDKQG